MFSYSDEGTSGSFHLDGKSVRSTAQSTNIGKRRLMSIQRRISQARNKQPVGQGCRFCGGALERDGTVGWEGGFLCRLREIDGVCYINDFGPGEPPVGDLRRIRITKAQDYDLVGELVDSPRNCGEETRTHFALFRPTAFPMHRLPSLIADARYHRTLTRNTRRMPDSKPAIVVPFCKERSRMGRPYITVCSDQLPDHRSGELGVGKVLVPPPGTGRRRPRCGTTTSGARKAAGTVG